MHRRIVVWIVDAASRSPYLTLALALAAMLAFAGCARRLEVRSDLLELLPRDSPGVRAFEHQLGRVGGGSTLIVDLTVPEVKYRIVKHIDSKTRQERTAEFVRAAAADPLRALFFSPDRREPFAALHALADDGV